MKPCGRVWSVAPEAAGRSEKSSFPPPSPLPLLLLFLPAFIVFVSLSSFPYNFLRAAFFLSAPLMPLPVSLFPVVASWEAGSVFRCKSGKCCGWECCTGADLFEGHHSHSLFQCKTLLSLTVSLLHLMFSGLGKNWPGSEIRGWLQ